MTSGFSFLLSSSLLFEIIWKIGYYVASSQIKALGSDEHGGVVAVWNFGTYDSTGTAVGGTYIQRIDAVGTLLWEENGRLILSGATAVKAIIDQKGSAFVIAYRSSGPNMATLTLAK